MAQHLCTFEWDTVEGKDDRGDNILKRHICRRPMHHLGDHLSPRGKSTKATKPYKTKKP